MTSLINFKVPITGRPTTESERNNWRIAWSEISDLQLGVAIATGATEAGAATIVPLPDADPGFVGTNLTYARADHVHPSDTSRLPLTGGTLSGPLVLAADPLGSKEAVTKSYADLRVSTTVASYLPLTGGQLLGRLTLSGDPIDELEAASRRWVLATAPTLAPVQSVAGRGGDVTLLHSDLTDWGTATAGLTPTFANITGGLGYVPYDTANPVHYQSDVQVASTVSTAVANYVPLSSKGIALGVPSLDATGRVPTVQLPAAATGTLNYRGGWNASTNAPAMTSGALVGGVLAPRGDYFVVTASGTTAAIDGQTTWVSGDWINSNGTTWDRVQNSTSPYLPLTGGALTAPGTVSGVGGFTFTDSDILRPGSSMMPDLARWWTGSAGNIPMALDNTGVLLLQRVQVFGQTSLAGLTVVGDANHTGNLSLTGNFSASGTGNFGGALTASALTFLNGDLEQVGASTMPDLARWVRDASGNIVFAFSTAGDTIVNNLQILGTLTAPGFIGGGGDDPNSFSPSLVTSRDALATANSMTVRGQTNTQVAQPIWTHNMVLIYGQSLSIGNQGLPRMSTDEGLDNLTLGNSPGGVQTATDYVFIPDQNSNINQLDGTRGYETPGISATNQWRALQLQWRDLTADPTRRLIVNGCGEGGKAIEELSKGYATPCYYDRIPSLLNQVKTAILAANPANTFGVVAVYYLQGEANYNPTLWDATQAGYLAKWEKLRTDIAADIKVVTGQKLPPAFFASQPNSEWDNSLHITSVGNAFVQAGITAPLGDYLCMPNYQVPNSNPNGPHMSPDGYRMMGNQVGHIMHRVFERGEGWFPLYVVKATYRGKQILLECHTPEPPLQTQTFYGGTDGSTVQPILTDLGFTAGDDLGALSITSIQLYNSVILINCSRAIATNAWVDYANKTPHEGNGNICDSDPFLSLDVFKTLPTAMLGKPYPGWNWMIAFRMNISSDV